MSGESPELIEQQISARRRAMLAKVDDLTDRTTGTVRSAVRSITDLSGTVSKAVGAVEDTAKQIRGLADPGAVTGAIRDAVQEIPLTRTVQQHPWTTVGGAALVGFLTGMIAARVGRTVPQSTVGRPSALSGLLDQVMERVGVEVRRVAQTTIDQAGLAISNRFADLTGAGGTPAHHANPESATG